ncbi:hypothetical protein ACWKWP_02270 [Agromyces soli]
MGTDEPVGTDPSADTDATSGPIGRDDGELRRLERRRRLAPWFVGLPFLVLAAMWIGILATVESMLSLGWLVAMWCSCLVMLPLAVTGAFWAGRDRERGTMIWGIIAAVLCLPGFVMGVSVLPSIVQSMF